MAIETNMLRNAREQMGGTAAPTQMTQAQQARMAQAADFAQRFREQQQQRRELGIGMPTRPQAVTPPPYVYRPPSQAEKQRASAAYESNQLNQMAIRKNAGTYSPSLADANFGRGTQFTPGSLTGTTLNYSGNTTPPRSAAPAPRATTAPGQQPTYGQYSDEQVRALFAQPQSARNFRTGQQQQQRLPQSTYDKYGGTLTDAQRAFELRFEKENRGTTMKSPPAEVANRIAQYNETDKINRANQLARRYPGSTAGAVTYMPPWYERHKWGPKGYMETKS